MFSIHALNNWVISIVFFISKSRTRKKLMNFRQILINMFLKQVYILFEVAPPLICLLLVWYYVLKVQISACPHSKIHSGNPNQLTKTVRQCKIILINKFP